MASSVIPELAPALLRGDAALWLGTEWKTPRGSESRTSLCSHAWLGIWSDAEGSEFADCLTSRRPGTVDSRLLIEVPEKIEDDLGEHYSIAEIVPYFYLRGKAGSETSMRPRQRDRSRDAKIEQLNRLGQAVLFVSGCTQPDELLATLEDICDLGPNLRLLALFDVPPSTQGLAQRQLPELQLAKLRFVNQTLVSFLTEVETRRIELPPGPSVLVGNTPVDISGLVRTEPPIDQDFLLVTQNDIRLPEEEENVAELLKKLLSGQNPPWRSLAHGLAWKRETDYERDVLDAMARVSDGSARVACLDIPTEAGSGLTVLLYQIAFNTAMRGCPTMFHIGETSRLNYHRLRAFLTDLYQGVEVPQRQVPAVLIFDAPSVDTDPLETLKSLPGRLAKDGRCVVMIRGIPIREGTQPDESPRRRYGKSVHRRTLPALRAGLGSAEQQDLAEWAERAFDRIGATLPPRNVEAIRGWDRERTAAPLLICMYFILIDSMLDAAQLGSHLVGRVRAKVPVQDGERPMGTGEDDDRPLRGKDLAKAAELLKRSFRRAGASFAAPPRADELGRLLGILSVLGCLRLPIRRGVLADLAGVERDRIIAAILCLEQCDIVGTNLPLGDPAKPDAGRRLAPIAFYDSQETVRVRHPAYGRLVLEYLSNEGGAADRNALGVGDFLDEAGICSAAPERIPNFPLRLLKPLLQKLRPRSDHVEFADAVALTYLRLQKRSAGRSDDLTRFQWNNWRLLLDAFDWMNPQIIRESPSLLHSRGITRYKTTDSIRDLSKCRDAYDSAVEDLARARDGARQIGGEHPGNIITSLGLLYKGWAERERDENNQAEWKELKCKAKQTLRDALRERSDNPFASFGLAEHLVEDVHLRLSEGSREHAAIANDLGEALQLLSAREPEPYFEAQWNELKAKAVMLLGGSDAQELIAALKNDHDELGYALEAMRLLDGHIPSAAHEREDEERIGQANAVLREAQLDHALRQCSLANLLRYALFSTDPERLETPAYAQRFELLSQLVGTIYLDNPVWLFDYAMLAFQVGHFAEGADAFASLRKGKKFLDVPLEKACYLAKSPDSPDPMPVTLRVISAYEADDIGWGRVQHPVRFQERVKFSVRAFRSRGRDTRIGAVPRCFIRLRPAGPYAEPEARHS